MSKAVPVKECVCVHVCEGAVHAAQREYACCAKIMHAVQILYSCCA